MSAKTVDVICAILLVVGGLNWALVGIFNFNFVAWVFARAYIFARITYIVVGLAAVWQILQFRAIQKRW